MLYECIRCGFAATESEFSDGNCCPACGYDDKLGRTVEGFIPRRFHPGAYQKMTDEGDEK